MQGPSVKQCQISSSFMNGYSRKEPKVSGKRWLGRAVGHTRLRLCAWASSQGK